MERADHVGVSNGKMVALLHKNYEIQGLEERVYRIYTCLISKGEVQRKIGEIIYS